ncbi:MAG TPA: hypothetical protein VLA19_17230 [Herpetosiphonaceae bacterium]|nr:hypothetical protein [Herpetosiphonaceae bacterium]
MTSLTGAEVLMIANAGSRMCRSNAEFVAMVFPAVTFTHALAPNETPLIIERRYS